MSSIGNHGVVERNVMSTISADGKSVFRTSAFGFNKKAVTEYLDRLYAASAENEKKLNREVERLEDLNKDLENQNQLLNNRFSTLQKKVEDELVYMGEFRTRDKAFKEKVNQQQDRIQSLEKELSENRQLSEETEAKLAYSQSRIDKLQQLCVEKAAENKLLTERISSSEAQYSSQRSDFNRINSEAKQLREENNSLNEKLRTQNEEVASLQEKCSSLTESLQDSNSRISSFENEKSELNEKLNELVQQSHISSADFEKSKEENEKKLKAALEVNQQIKNENSALRDQLAASEARIAQIKEGGQGLLSSNESIRSELETVKAENERLDAEFRKLSTEVETLRKDNVKLKGDFKTANQLLETAKGVTINLSRRVQAGNEQINILQQEKQELYNKGRSEIDKLISIIGQRNSQISVLNNNIECSKKVIAKLRSENEQVSARLASSVSTSSGSEKKVQDLENILAQMQDRSVKLQQALQQKYAQYQDVVKRYNGAVNELRNREAYVAGLKNELNDARRKHMEYEFKINSLNGEMVRKDISLSQRDQEILALRKYISTLEERLGYTVGYQNGHRSEFEVAYRNDKDDSFDTMKKNQFGSNSYSLS